jgi:YkoY family integral membrane protein
MVQADPVCCTGLPPAGHLADLATVGFLVALESLLSADNALVMAVMVLALPARDHRRALNYGLIGALAFRLAATALAVYLIHAGWLKLVGGLYLFYLCASHFLRRDASGAASPQPDGRGAPFWSTVMRVEVVNLAFSVDSILVAVAMSPKFWVVVTGGLLGVAAMRLAVSQFVALIKRYPGLVDGAFVVIGWVALKLLLDYGHQMTWIAWAIPQAVSLALVIGILVVSYAIERRRAARAG